MMKSIKAPWCNWPSVSQAREIEDLYKVGARCDAWRAFLNSDTVKKLKRVKGYILWFNKWEHFDKLLCEFECTEKKLRAVIKSIMRPGHEMPIEFIRTDIYDAKGWTRLPLSCFAEIENCNERTGEEHWQYEILEKNEMPIVQFGLPMPWTVSRDCFTLTHCLKDDIAQGVCCRRRHAVMTFNHPQLDRRFDGKRWVADMIFPRESKRKEMTEKLFAKVKAECAKHLVTIKEVA